MSRPARTRRRLDAAMAGGAKMFESAASWISAPATRRPVRDRSWPAGPGGSRRRDRRQPRAAPMRVARRKMRRRQPVKESGGGRSLWTQTRPDGFEQRAWMSEMPEQRPDRRAGRCSPRGPAARTDGQRRQPARPARLRTVDFSRPTKFTSDHQRRIARAIDAFCQTAVDPAVGRAALPIELETINTTQLTWSAAQSQLPPGLAVGAVARRAADRTRACC